MPPSAAGPPNEGKPTNSNDSHTECGPILEQYDGIEPLVAWGPQTDEIDNDNNLEELLCDPLPSQAPAPTKPEPCDPQDTLTPRTPPKFRNCSAEMPVGVKPLNLNFSKIASEALPYKNDLDSYCFFLSDGNE